MSNMSRLRMLYCNVLIDELLTAGPFIIKNGDSFNAIAGTKQGNLVSIPLIFSKSQDFRKEYQKIKIGDKNIVNLKQLFLDQEFSSAIISYKQVNEKSCLVTLQDGRTFFVEGNKKKIFHEAEGTVNVEPEYFGIEGKGYMALGSEDGYLYIVDSKGKEVSRINTESPINSKPVFCTKNKTLLVGNDSGKMHCYSFNPKNSSLAKKWVFDTGKAIVAAPVWNELFNDGRIFILFGSTNKNFYCLDDDGSLVWKFPTDGRIISEAFVDDINNDEIKEIIMGSCDDKVYVLNAYGNEIWDYETDFWIATKPLVVDVDDDKYKEIFIGSYDNNLYCFSPEADFVPSFFSGASGIIQQSASFENPDIEETSGYFAKKLFQIQFNGMIIGMDVFLHSNYKIVAAITNRGEFRAIKFEK